MKSTFMKKAAGVLCAAALAATMAPVCALADDISSWFSDEDKQRVADRFPDVSVDDWFVQGGYLPLIVDSGMMGGYSDGRFAPYDHVKRGQVVTIFYRFMQGFNATDLGPTPVTGFRDVDWGEYYGDAVRWAASWDIVTGYIADFDDGQYYVFNPEGDVSRQDLATMMGRFAKFLHSGFASWKGDWSCDESVLDRFVDTNASYPSNLLEGYARPYAAWCVQNEIMTGVLNTDDIPLLQPTEPAQRCQMAKMMAVFYSLGWTNGMG